MTTRSVSVWLRPWRWALVAVLCLLACNAPFIPVPPPDNVFVPVTETISDGTGNSTKTVWVTQGKPDARASLATFYITNTNLHTGVFVEAQPDGSYTAPAIDGTRGDQIFLYYVTQSGSTSETVCRQLVEGDPAPVCSP